MRQLVDQPRGGPLGQQRWDGQRRLERGAKPRPWAALGLVLGTAGLVFLAFPRVSWWPLTYVALAPLGLAAVQGRGFVRGWMAGATANLAGMFWVVHLLRVFGHLPTPVAVLGWILLAAWQGLPLGLWGWFVERTSGVRPAWWLPLVWSAGLVTVDWAVPTLFPWSLGNGLVGDLPALQVAELVGVPGLDLVAGLVSSSLVLTLSGLGSPPVRGRWLLGTLALLAVVHLWGEHRIGEVEALAARAPEIDVGIVEGDVGILDKGTRGPRNLALHQHLSRVARAMGAELVVWPETAYDLSRIRLGPRLEFPPGPLPSSPGWDEVEARARGRDHLILYHVPPLPRDVPDTPRAVVVAPSRGLDVPLLFGAVTWEPASARGHRERHYNSALLIDSQGRLDGRVQHKQVLLPFGEYLPLGHRLPWLHDLLPAASDFTPGGEAVLLRLGSWRVAALICYEAILPDQVRRVVGEGPNLLVNLTNDAWFGRLWEPWQHLALAIPRAVEHRLALVRATNTGVSAFVSPTGRILDHSALDHPEVMVRAMPLMEGPTVYQEVGWTLPWACLVVSLVAVTAARRRRGRDQGGSPLLRSRPRTSRA